MDSMDAAVVFPGQGAQRSGMGRDFFENFTVSARTYEEASQALGWDVAALCFSQDERLNLTEFAQPCILTTEIAMMRALETEFGLAPRCFGGHSLGEYAALTAAGALPLGHAVRLVHERGRLMQQACPEGFGAMAAVISPQLDVEAAAQCLQGLDADVANINSPDQIVVSGEAASVDEALARLKEALNGAAPRFVRLNVSAPFHSRFMRSISEAFSQVLETHAAGLEAEAATRVASNVSGGFHEPDAGAVRRSLAAQLSSPVRWVDNMNTLASAASAIIEVGPNRPLRGFFKSIGAQCTAVTSASGAAKALGALS